ncbi:MAG: molybdopterin synthase catalytic subunit [Acidimicrobiales bacterium]
MDEVGTRDSVVITDAALEPAELAAWATRPGCGAVVTFCGTVRDTSDDRDGIEALEYETDPDLARRRIDLVVESARSRWPDLGAVAIHHRIGRVDLTEASVVVVVSAPHRDVAFSAARFCIDAVKETVPLYKRDVWKGGSAWSRDARPVTDLSGS